MLLVVSDITAGYDDLDILHGASLHVGEGEIVTIIGPNGAGKSTLMKVIFGILRPRRGNVRFASTDVTGAPPRRLLSLGLSYVPQARSVFPHLTVRENLLMGGFILDDRARLKERIEQVLTLFPRLGERMEQKAGNLSGGEQRMLEIGRSLLLDPKLIILDEPTIGLAPKVADLIFETVITLHRSGRSVLMVEQNARAALAVSHRGYVMEQGAVRLEDAAHRLLDNEEVRRLYLGG